VLAAFLLALVSCASYRPLPLTPGAVDQALTIPSADILTREAGKLHHPLLRPVKLDPDQPLSPEQAAVLAVLVNPALRAQRDRAGVSSAQLMAAGLLPNPVLSSSLGILTGGPGTANSFSTGPTWDVMSLLTREVKIQSARASLAQVRLDIAWSEWRTAEAAKGAVFALVALQRELGQARDIDRLLNANLRVVQGAYRRHERTILQLAAGRTASDSAHATALALAQQVAQQRMALLRALGVPADTPIRVRRGIPLASHLKLPSERQLLTGLASRRLDLIALHRGYQSQEYQVRLAVLEQFPRISLGISRAKDNTGVYSVDLSAGIELPIFNHHQAAIAQQHATRRQLYDEYIARVFTARADIATLLADVGTLTPQIAAAKAALPALQQLVKTYRTAVEQGNADVLSYYSAWNSLDQKRIALLGLEQQLESDRIALELAAGEPLPQPGERHSARPGAEENG
jgi:outer membrane protein TolC